MKLINEPVKVSNFDLQKAFAEDPVCLRAAENKRDAFHMERRLQQGIRSHPSPGSKAT